MASGLRWGNRDRFQNMQDVMGLAKDFKFNSLKYTKCFSLGDFLKLFLKLQSLEIWGPLEIYVKTCKPWFDLSWVRTPTNVLHLNSLHSARCLNHMFGIVLRIQKMEELSFSSHIPEQRHLRPSQVYLSQPLYNNTCFVQKAFPWRRR